MAFSVDSRSVATGSVDGTVKIWEVTSKGQVSERCRLEGSREKVANVFMSYDGKSVFAGDSHGTVCVWQLPISSLIEGAERAVNRELTEYERKEYGIERRR